MQHAHQKGNIHRDVKPNSVLVTLHDANRMNSKLGECRLLPTHGEEDIAGRRIAGIEATLPCPAKVVLCILTEPECRLGFPRQ